MSLFGDFKDAVFGITPPAPVTIRVPAPIPAPMPNAAPIVAPVVANDVSPSADIPYDQVGMANKLLGDALSKHLVKKRMINPATGQESWLQVGMPVASVSINGYHSEQAKTRPFMEQDAHEGVTLAVSLRDAVGNYDIDSLNHALHTVLGNIPGIKGKIELAHDVSDDQLDHADIWKQLRPALEATSKFTAQEIGLIGEYFATHQHQTANGQEWSHYRVEHANDHLQISIYPAEVSGDEKEIASGEMRVIEYFNQYKQPILAKLREKVTAMNAQLKDGDPLKMTEAEIDGLDFTAADEKSTGGRDTPTITIGTKPTLMEVTLGKSKIVDFDTDKLLQCFKDAVMESGVQPGGQPGVPYIFGRIADGDMVRELVHHRVGFDANSAVDKAMNHPMFNSQMEQRSHAENNIRKDIMHMPNAVEDANANDLQLFFDLPHGMGLGNLRENIVKHARDLAPQPQGLAA